MLFYVKMTVVDFVFIRPPFENTCVFIRLDYVKINTYLGTGFM